MTTLIYIVAPMLAAALVGLGRHSRLQARAGSSPATRWRASGSPAARPNHPSDAGGRRLRDGLGWILCPLCARF